MTGFLLFAFIIFMVRADEVYVKFIGDYFESRGVSLIAAFGCWNIFEKVEVFRGIESMNTKLLIAEISNNLSMKEILKVNYYKLGVFLDLDCPRSELILDQFVDERLAFNESYFWLLRSTADQLPLELLGRLPLSINAELTLAMRESGGKARYELYDVYNPSYRHGGELNVTRMGYWSDEGGIRNELTQYKYKRRGNLNGMYLNFSIVVDFPPKTVDMDTYLTNPIDRHLDTMHRYNYALTRQLRDYYNFTMNLMPGTTWGYLINGSFNGIIGDFIKGVVDIGATPFQFKPERIDVMEYTVQAYMANVRVVFRHPKKQELNNSFLEPFTSEVWVLTAIVGLINWLVLYITVRVERYYLGVVRNSTLLTQPESETFLITSAAICQQGLSDTPRVFSGRIVYIFLFIWAMLLYQFYSASIVGSLLAEKPRFIKTIKDLSDSNIEIGVENMQYNHDFFRTTTNEDVIELFQRKIALNKRRKKFPYYTAEEGLKKVQKGGFGLQVDLATAYKIIRDTFDENEICDLEEIELFGPKHTATGTAKHSPFKKMVTYGLRQIVERGMAQRLISVWKPKRPQCPESHSSTPVPVSLAEFSPALVMISVAFCLSTSIMLVENILVKSLLPSLLRIGEKISSEERSLESGERTDDIEDDIEDIGEI